MDPFLNMMILSLSPCLYLWVWFFYSSVSKNQNVIPFMPIFYVSAIFLSELFFQASLPAFFNRSLILPLTAVNDAMRNVAFEGVLYFPAGNKYSFFLVGYSHLHPYCESISVGINFFCALIKLV